MKLRNLFFGMLTLWSIGVSAQKSTAVIKLKEETFDFGTIKESNGKVSHVFEFSNTGSIPLIITDVKPACDCTTPEWTRQPILPGKTGTIKATYDPKDRGGYFQKEIKVITNANPSTITLKITGMVVQKEPIVEQKYAFNLGDVRFTKSYYGFDTVYNTTQKKIDKGEVINVGKTPVEIVFTLMPSYIKVIPSRISLKAGEKGTFAVVINGTAVNDWGFVFGYPQFTINNISKDNYKFTISANLLENFDKLSAEEKADAPVAVIENPVYNFGTVTSGSKVEHNFDIKNNGKRDLIIRKISSTCGCTTFAPSDNVIKAGQTGSIKAVFDTHGRSDEQTKALTVITNISSQRSITLTLKGNVEKLQPAKDSTDAKK
jgi:hypothetical protein